VIEAGQYAIDSTGFSTAGYDRWFSQKHGKLCSKNTWVKLHVMVGTVTHAVTSAVVTSEGDCPQLPALLARTRAPRRPRALGRQGVLVRRQLRGARPARRRRLHPVQGERGRQPAVSSLVAPPLRVPAPPGSLGGPLPPQAQCWRRRSR
jgi:hypothetical protein